MYKQCKSGYSLKWGTLIVVKQITSLSPFPLGKKASISYVIIKNGKIE